MQIHAIRYSHTVFKENELSSITEINSLLSDETVLWVDVTDPDGREALEPLEKMLDLHPLALDDCMNIRQRPKVEDYKSHLFIVARGIDLDLEVGRFVEGLQLGILLGKGFVITVHKTPIPLERIRENLKSRKPPPDIGVSFLLYILLDTMVDSFETEEGSMEEHVRRVEDEVLGRSKKETLTEIFNNRRNLLLLRKMMRPQRDAIRLLLEEGHPIIHPTMSLYLRDVFDHAERTLDAIDTQLGITSGSLDIYLSLVSNRMNDIIKVLTMINTIFMPLTLIVGLYTITFPAAYPKWEYGPILMIFIMTLMVSLIIFIFKKRKWF